MKCQIRPSEIRNGWSPGCHGHPYCVLLCDLDAFLFFFLAGKGAPGWDETLLGDETSPRNEAMESFLAEGFFLPDDSLRPSLSFLVGVSGIDCSRVGLRYPFAPMAGTPAGTVCCQIPRCPLGRIRWYSIGCEDGLPWGIGGVPTALIWGFLPDRVGVETWVWLWGGARACGGSVLARANRGVPAWDEGSF